MTQAQNERTVVSYTSTTGKPRELQTVTLQKRRRYTEFDDEQHEDATYRLHHDTGELYHCDPRFTLYRSVRVGTNGVISDGE